MNQSPNAFGVDSSQQVGSSHREEQKLALPVELGCHSRKNEFFWTFVLFLTCLVSVYLIDEYQRGEWTSKTAAKATHESKRDSAIDLSSEKSGTSSDTQISASGVNSSKPSEIDAIDQKTDQGEENHSEDENSSESANAQQISTGTDHDPWETLLPRVLAVCVCYVGSLVSIWLNTASFEQKNPLGSLMLGMLIRTAVVIGAILVATATKWSNHNLFSMTLVGCYFSFLALESSLSIKRIHSRI